MRRQAHLPNGEPLAGAGVAAGGGGKEGRNEGSDSEGKGAQPTYGVDAQLCRHLPYVGCVAMAFWL